MIQTSGGLPIPDATGDPRRPRGVLLGATAMLSGFVLFQTPMVLEECRGLIRDWELSRVGEPLGFVGIAPDPTFASPPDPWVYVDGHNLLLWGRWEEGKGHRWFRVGKDDLDPKSLGLPMGRDTVRSIERTMVQGEGGQIWERMRPDTKVVGLRIGSGKSVAYPLIVLRKVEAVNDVVDGRPLLVLSTPFETDEESVDVFDPVLNGRRLTLGLSGHLVNPGPRPLLYDHQTESLWVVRDHALRCIGGPLKGREMARMEHGVPEDWSRWQVRNPDGRLVVGAFRGVPGTTL